MKTKLLLITLSSFLAAGLLLFAAGCEEPKPTPTPTPTATITEITMATGVDADNKPVKPTSKFTTDTARVFCSAKMNDAPPGTKVTGRWAYLSGELPGVTGYVIDSASVDIEGTKYFVLSLSKPTNGWPRGLYAVTLLVNDKEVASAPFSVA